MTTITLIGVNLNNPPTVGGYYVSIAWRYGTSGGFTGLVPSTFVNNDGTLLTPIDIVYDETVNASIQVRALLLYCAGSQNYYQIIP